jgi:FkbH-like protein
MTRIGIALNGVAPLLCPQIEEAGKSLEIDIEVIQGTFANPIADFESFQNKECDLIYFLVVLDLLIDAFPSRILFLSSDEKKNLINRVCQELEVAISRVSSKTPIRIMLIDAASMYTGDRYLSLKHFRAELEISLSALNSRSSNVSQIQGQQTLDQLGSNKWFKLRDLLRSSSPFTLQGSLAIAGAIANDASLLSTKAKKVIVVDADNTLWGGVVGEVGARGIQINPTSYPGNVYWAVQNLLKEYSKMGVILCLASKNELTDIQSAFEDNQHMVLSLDDFVVRKISWLDKSNSIQEIGIELNLNLNSFVFVDDSDFEVNAVKSQLPMVNVFQVPKEIPDYARLVEDLGHFFEMTENSARVEQYRVRAAAAELENQSSTREEFLTSLQTRLSIRYDSTDDAGRVSEMSRRTNQFNSNLQEFSEDEIRSGLINGTISIITGSVSDVFGNSGIALAAVIEQQDREFYVTGLWTSCRVLGREVETAFVGEICKHSLGKHGSLPLFRFAESAQNQQVSALFEKLEFKKNQTDKQIDYEPLNLKQSPSWITIE